MDIESFVTALTASPPKPPHSVELELDCDGDPVALYEALLTAFITMLKKWYAPPIDLKSISEERIRECASYFASFGVLMQIEISEIPRVLRINNKEYETKERLQDMRFQMTSGSRLFTLWFSFL